MLGIMPTSQAQRLADGQGLDLVEITPNAVPPVCKIMDYGKFRYEESIRAKKARKAQKSTQVKEIKFHPGTDTGDLQHKLRQIRQFLGEGNKVRLSLQFRGRENAHRDIGEDKIAEVLEMLKDECFVEQAPKTDGRVHFCLIGPPRAKKGGGRPQIAVRRVRRPPAASRSPSAVRRVRRRRSRFCPSRARARTQPVQETAWTVDCTG